MQNEIIDNINITMKQEKERIENNFMSSSANINNQKEKIEENLKVNIKKEILPKVKIKKLMSYPTSIYPYFFISFGLLYLSCNSAWSEYGSSSLSIPFLIIGIIQYILGIYDFYQGNNFLFILNIIVGIRYINFFMNYFEINGLKRTKKLFSSMQGIIDFIFFIFICIFTIIMKGEGIIYFINFFFLVITTAFFILSGYAESYPIIIKINGYLLFFNSFCFFLTGVILVLHDTYKKKLVKFVEPRIK